MTSLQLQNQAFWTCILFVAVLHVTSSGDIRCPPIQLQDIGYYGSWEQFCDRRQIDKDFPLYPDHELRVLRIMICEMKERNEINRDSMAPFAGYKYCEMMRQCADDFLEKLIERFSQGDNKKKDELLTRGSVPDQTECSRHAILSFGTLCIEEMNPFHRMFRPLIARACSAHWLTMENILSHFKEVCSGKKLTADINWEPIVTSIYCDE